MSTPGRPETHYTVLGVAPNASLEEIKRRYHEIALQHHPDVCDLKAGVVFVRANSAYQILRDPEKRRVYDAALGGEAPKKAGPPPPPPIDAAAVLTQAEAAYMQGRADEAHVLCQKVLRADGRNVTGLTLLADVLIQKGQLERAAIALRLALQIAPNPLLQSKMNRLRQTLPPGQGASAAHGGHTNFRGTP